MRAPTANRSRASLWWGLLGGHVAWTVQLLAGFALAGPACEPGSVLAVLALAAVSVATLAAAIASGAAAFALARRAGAPSESPLPLGEGQGEGGSVADDTTHRDRALGVIGVLLSALFGYLIVLTAASLLLAGSCAA